jgi:hypothetical protein
MKQKRKKIFSDACFARLLNVIALSLIIGMIIFSHKQHKAEKKEVLQSDSVQIKKIGSRR